VFVHSYENQFCTSFVFLLSIFSGTLSIGKLMVYFNPLNTELNPICHLLALLGAHPIFHISRIRVNTVLNATTYTYLKGVYVESWQHISVVYSTIIRP